MQLSAPAPTPTPSPQSTAQLQAQVLSLIQEWAYTLKPAQFSNAFNKLKVGVGACFGVGVMGWVLDELLSRFWSGPTPSSRRSSAMPSTSSR